MEENKEATTPQCTEHDIEYSNNATQLHHRIIYTVYEKCKVCDWRRTRYFSILRSPSNPDNPDTVWSYIE